MDAIVQSPACPESIKHKLLREIPKKIDENFFRMRQQFEWISLLTKEYANQAGHPLSAVSQLAAECLERVHKHQEATAAAVTTQVQKLLPNDWRMSIMKKKRTQKEHKNQKDLEEMMKKPSYTLDTKYDLLWQQQMERRESLAELGNSSGIKKFLIQKVGGVPQVLLDFVKQINHAEGPMEEMRIKYGPRVYSFTKLANALHIQAAVLASTDATLSSAVDQERIAHSMKVLHQEIHSFMDFMYNLFEKSPFFISAADAREASGQHPLAEHGIAAREVYDEHVEVASDDIQHGATLSVRFHVDHKDIKFGIWLGDVEVVSSRSVDHKEGEVNVEYKPVKAGTYIIRWDNTYSRMTSKLIHYDIQLTSKQSEQSGQSVQTMQPTPVSA
eukprot:ANDGO_05497.mRNA.1 hypothetical protein